MRKYYNSTDSLIRSVKIQFFTENGAMSPASTLSADTLVDMEDESQQVDYSGKFKEYFFNFCLQLQSGFEIMTAAERVKLRRESKNDELDATTTKSKTAKKNR